MEVPPAELQPTDIDQLKMLSQFNKIGMWVFGLMSCCGLPHSFFGFMMLSGGYPASGGKSEPPDSFGVMFLVAGLAVMLFHLVLALSCRYVMDWLTERTHYNFIVAQAAILCMFAPLGTALGVFTLVVMTRPQVRAVFKENR